jgi:hypothetical protein
MTLFEELKQRYDYIIVIPSQSLVNVTLLIAKKNGDIFIYVAKSQFLERKVR